MKSLKITCAAFLIASSTLFSQTLQDATRLTTNEQFENADAAFKKLIAAQPNNGEIYFYYGENFLSTQKESPYSILQTNKLWCRPCSKIGYKKCPLGHFKCMEHIRTEDIIQSVQQWL